MKKSDFDLRKQALEKALYAVTSGEPPEQTVRRAEKFLAFLKGEPNGEIGPAPKKQAVARAPVAPRKRGRPKKAA